MVTVLPVGEVLVIQGAVQRNNRQFSILIGGVFWNSLQRKSKKKYEDRVFILFQILNLTSKITSKMAD